MGQCPSLRSARNEPYKEIMSWKERKIGRRNSSRHFVYYHYLFFLAIDVIQTCKGCFSGRDALPLYRLLHWFPHCSLENLIFLLKHRSPEHSPPEFHHLSKATELGHSIPGMHITTSCSLNKSNNGKHIFGTKLHVLGRQRR